MTNVYSTACTPWFIAAQQAVPAGGAPVNLLGGTLKVGDGNGAVPTISQLIANGGVLHQVWAGAPNSVTIDATNTGQIDVGCLIPTVDGSGNEIGPFNVTEFAIYDATGNLAIVGTTNLQKTTSAQGQLMTLQWFACYIAAAANAVTLQPPAGSFPTLGQVQSGVAGLLSAQAPITVTPTVQPSGWTDWLLSIASATLTALGIGRPATDAEFAAGAPVTGGYAFPWVQIEQVTAALGRWRAFNTVPITFTVSAAEMGQFFQTPTVLLGNYSGALVSAASVPQGSVIGFYNSASSSGYTMTLSSNNFNTAYGAGASIVIPPNQSLVLTSDGISWNGTGGSGSQGAPVKPQMAAGVGQWVNLSFSGSGASCFFTLPAGGTWAYCCSNNGIGAAGVAAGGSNVLGPFTASNAFGFAWRIA